MKYRLRHRQWTRHGHQHHDTVNVQNVGHRGTAYTQTQTHIINMTNLNIELRFVMNVIIHYLPGYFFNIENRQGRKVFNIIDL